KALELTLEAPDVNRSQWMFVATNAHTVCYGLGAIKGVGRGVCDAIAQERAANGPYTDLPDFCVRVSAGGLNRRTLEALIRAGALDGLASNRATLMQQLPYAMRAADQQHQDSHSGQS